MSALDPIKKFTFHPARFNATQQLATEIAESLCLKPSVSKVNGYITVYYTDLEFLAMYFWTLGVNQKIKTIKPTER